jgi:low affinity Fe/Cu permease
VSRVRSAGFSILTVAIKPRNLSLHLPFQGMAIRKIQHTLTTLGTAGSRPWAFITVLVYAAAWLLFQPDSLDMHGVATLMVWMMTLFIQRAEYRDTQATQAKLDELLAAISTARNDLAKIDEEEPEDIERRRDATREEVDRRCGHRR